jgi:F-type H+-transporting ATPase subunit a
VDSHSSWFDYLLPLSTWEHAIAERFGHDEGMVTFTRPALGAIAAALFVSLLILAGAFVVRRRIADPQAAIVPDTELSVRTVFELILDAVYGMMKGIMAPNAARYFLPLIATAAFFILVSNLLGLVPGFQPPTSTWSVTLALGLVTFFATHVFGVREHGLKYFKHFFGPVIKWYAILLMVLMLVIELVSHAVRPLSLSVRLMANMFADHQTVGAFYNLAAWIVPIPVLTLGILVCVVQTLVFCLLSTIYISMAVAHEEH